MLDRDFSKVFNFFPLVDDASLHVFENSFLDSEDGFLWDISARNSKKTENLVEDMVEYDFGLKNGEVISLMTSLGIRMIAIGTCLGNVVIHERQRFRRVEEHDGDGTGPVILTCYFPQELEDLIGLRPLKDEQVYRYTGFFNTENNIGKTLGRLKDTLSKVA